MMKDRDLQAWQYGSCLLDLTEACLIYCAIGCTLLYTIQEVVTCDNACCFVMG